MINEQAILEAYIKYTNCKLPFKETVGLLTDDERTLIKLEYFASNRFLTEATSNRKIIGYARKDLNNFISEYTTPQNFNSGIILCNEQKINELERMMYEHSYLLDKITDAVEHLSRATMPIERHFTNGKQYTELSPRQYYAAIPKMKELYLTMVDLIQKATNVKDKIYVPGWDKINWEDEPSKFFDKNSKIVYPSTYNGRKYGQLSVTICEVDGLWRKRLPEYIIDVCSKIIPEEYNMDYINPNQIGFYVTSIEKSDNTVAVVLSTNYFIWR